MNFDLLKKLVNLQKKNFILVPLYIILARVIAYSLGFNLGSSKYPVTITEIFSFRYLVTLFIGCFIGFLIAIVLQYIYYQYKNSNKLDNVR